MGSFAIPAHKYAKEERIMAVGFGTPKKVDIIGFIIIGDTINVESAVVITIGATNHLSYALGISELHVPAFGLEVESFCRKVRGWGIGSLWVLVGTLLETVQCGLELGIRGFEVVNLGFEIGELGILRETLDAKEDANTDTSAG